MFNLHISFIYLVCDEEVTNIYCPTSVTSSPVYIFLQGGITLVILIQNMLFNIVSLILNKTICPQKI